jgi:hypothetical protein
MVIANRVRLVLRSGTKIIYDSVTQLSFTDDDKHGPLMLISGWISDITDDKVITIDKHMLRDVIIMDVEFHS